MIHHQALACICRIIWKRSWSVFTYVIARFSSVWYGNFLRAYMHRLTISLFSKHSTLIKRPLCRNLLYFAGALKLNTLSVVHLFLFFFSRHPTLVRVRHVFCSASPATHSHLFLTRYRRRSRSNKWRSCTHLYMVPLPFKKTNKQKKPIQPAACSSRWTKPEKFLKQNLSQYCWCYSPTRSIHAL